MRKLILFMHVSLDGFVANSKKAIDWVKVDEEIFDYSNKFIENSDTALYGRVTYQMMEAYWPTAADSPSATKHDLEHSKWYNNATKLVLSRTIKSTNKKTKVIEIKDLIKIKQEKGKDILIFGSPGAAHSLMQEKLIDEYWLFVNPILLAEGTPLFSNLKNKINLKLLTTKVFSNGVVALRYERK